MAEYLLDKHLSGIALNPGKLVQTQTALSADQFFIGMNRPLVQGISTIWGLDLENIHRFIAGQSQWRSVTHEARATGINISINN